jgi:hypothetical protein
MEKVIVLRVPLPGPATGNHGDLTGKVSARFALLSSHVVGAEVAVATTPQQGAPTKVESLTLVIRTTVAEANRVPVGTLTDMTEAKLLRFYAHFDDLAAKLHDPNVPLIVVEPFDFDAP